ncbi:MAG: kelch repeat-containing protein [Actinomycetota bacterium]|nr:kelch repeat-containing protein [Actinomycetota bacterium]
MTTSRFEATATLLTDGRVLVAGGLGSTGSVAATGLQYPPQSTAEIYDPAVGAFTGAGRMATGRAQQVAARLPDGSVVVAGGGGANGLLALSSTGRFNPATGAWTTLANLAVAGTGAAATDLADGSVLVAGGQAVNQGSSSSLASAELFDPTRQTWRSAGRMSCPRSGLAAAPLSDGSAVEVAGDTAFPGQPPVAQGCVDRYTAASSGH